MHLRSFLVGLCFLSVLCSVFAATATSPPKSYRSHLPWASGLSTQATGTTLSNGDTSQVTAALQEIDRFEQYRVRKVDIWNSKSDSSSFSSLISSIGAKQNMYQALYSRNISVEQVLDYIPDDYGSISGFGQNYFGACAAGRFNSQHTQLAQLISSMPRRAPYVIRLGHELNDPGNIYNPNNDPNAPNSYTTYKNCFCTIAAIYHNNVKNPPALIDWNWLRNTAAQGVSPSKTYPGNDCVDIIGVDSYNNNVLILEQGDFDKYANKVTSDGWPSGPRSWMNFAKSNGRAFGIAEWGVSNVIVDHTDDKSSDSTVYIKGMFGLYQEAANLFADCFFYESYFNSQDGDVDHRINDGQGDNRNPNATQQYKVSWKL